MKRKVVMLVLAGLLLAGCMGKEASESSATEQPRPSAVETPSPATEQTTEEPAESPKESSAPIGTGEPVSSPTGSSSPAYTGQPSEPPANPAPTARAEEPAIEEPSDEPVAIAENLRTPWAIDIFENTFYISERPGSIVKIENGKMERQRVELTQKLSDAAEAGLLGFALAPDFLETKRAYAYYTYEDGSGQYNRIVTLLLKGNVWKEEVVLLDRIPSGSVHHGGRLKLGPDLTLFATAGDAADANLAQVLDSLAGKILRLQLDGSVPDDNPFPGSYVYSYGHRNPQGLAWAPDGQMYASEHGNRANDEINMIDPGLNYGWPIIQGTEEQVELVTPLFTSGTSTTWAPSGMEYYNGKLYVAALRGTAVMEFDPVAGSQRKVITGYGRIRDVRIDGDYLYFITNNTDGRGNPQPGDDKLYRVLLSKL